MKHPINLEQLESLTDGDKAFEKDMIVLFCETAEQCITHLGETADGNNPDCWKEKAHELKGAAANMGAETLASLCGKAQESHTAPPQEKRPILVEIQKEYAVIQQFFEERNRH